MPPSEPAPSPALPVLRFARPGSPGDGGHLADGGSASKWFAEDVQPYEPALRAYLLKRFPSLPDHDDLVQETYRRLLRMRDRGRLTYVKAFLFTAARNVAIDMFRRRRNAAHEPISDSEEMPLLEERRDVFDALDQQQRRELLVEAVTALPARCREVMLLRHREGLSYKEIAARLGISPQTVKVHMVKGVRDCTEFFRQRGLLAPAAQTPRERADEEVSAP